MPYISIYIPYICMYIYTVIKISRNTSIFLNINNIKYSSSIMCGFIVFSCYHQPFKVLLSGRIKCNDFWQETPWIIYPLLLYIGLTSGFYPIPKMIGSICCCCFSDGIAYSFGNQGGLITFSFGENERTDTREDSLAFGFISVRRDGVLLRVTSGNSNDYIELVLVSSYSLPI